MGKRITEFDESLTIPAGAKFLFEDLDGIFGDENAYYYIDYTDIVAGDTMLASVYDPTGVVGDAFDMGNMVESATAKVLTDAERTLLTGLAGHTTHSGQVSGAGALTVEPEAITDYATVTPASGDFFLFVDLDDGALKKADFASMGGGGGGSARSDGVSAFWPSPGQI